MKIEYELEGAGWATATIYTRSSSVTVDVSDLNDSLTDLANAAINLGADTNKAVIVFINEPGDHQLILQKIDPEIVQVLLHWHDGSNKPEPQETRLETTAKIKVFQHNVLHIMDGLLQEHGLEGYKEKWQSHDFPVAEYGRLKKLLGKE